MLVVSTVTVAALLPALLTAAPAAQAAATAPAEHDGLFHTSGSATSTTEADFTGLTVR